MFIFAIVCDSIAISSLIPCGNRSSMASASNYVIVDCAFKSIAASSDGGSVYISSPASNLSVNNSIISSSYSSGSGGGFFFNGTALSTFALCGCDCTAASNTSDFYLGGQLFFSVTTSSASMCQLSVCRCSNSTLIGQYNAFSSQYGTVDCVALNSSHNTVQCEGACFVFRYSSYHNVSFSNLLNCTTSLYWMVYFDYITLAQINFTNIVGNTMGGSIHGICFSYSGNLTMYSCVFINNSGLCLFDNMQNCWLNVIGSWISSSSETLISGSVFTDGCSLCITKTIEPTHWGSSVLETSCGYRITCGFSLRSYRSTSSIFAFVFGFLTLN